MMMLGFNTIEFMHSLNGECGAMKRSSTRWHKKKNTVLNWSLFSIDFKANTLRCLWTKRREVQDKLKWL